MLQFDYDFSSCIVIALDQDRIGAFLLNDHLDAFEHAAGRGPVAQARDVQVVMRAGAEDGEGFHVRIACTIFS